MLVVSWHASVCCDGLQRRNSCAGRVTAAELLVGRDVVVRHSSIATDCTRCCGAFQLLEREGRNCGIVLYTERDQVGEQ